MAVELKKLLRGMLKVEASDLHLKVGQKPTIRIDGKLRQVEHPILTAEDTLAVNREMMPERCNKTLDEDGSADYSYALNEFDRFRVNAYFQRGQLSMAIRAVSSKPPTVEDLQLPPTVSEFTKAKRGLVLVTGITGSGKSSTLAALIGIINRTRRDHIITIEDPIEFLYRDEKCLVQQIEVGFDVSTFQLATRNVLRQDPDVILIGELRDRTTVQVALQSVESGHLVFSTLHTADAKQTFLRLLHFYSSEEHALLREQLALNLNGVIAQRLLRIKEGRGRIPCCEILFVNPVIQKLIREDRFSEIDAVLQSGQDGMQSFDDHLLHLVKAERITIDEALLYSHDQAAFMRAVKGKMSGGDRGSLLGSF